MLLSAGERRSFTANTILRDPAWRKKDGDGALRVSPADADRLGLADGGTAQAHHEASQRSWSRSRWTTRCSPATSRSPTGSVSITSRRASGDQTGVAPNEFTASEDRDPWAGTPWHKTIPARLEPV